MNNNQTQNQNQTDLQQAADNINPNELAANLTTVQATDNVTDKVTDQATKQPQNLDHQEATPFIDETLRTDK